MRWLSLVLAALLLIVALIAFLRGLGPLIAIGEYSEAWHLSAPVVWAIAVVYLGALYGGIICCGVFFGGFRRAFGSAFDRRASLGDWLVGLGHAALIGGIVDAVLWSLQMYGISDLFYLLAMVAAALYSAGLGALALTLRSIGPASGAPVS